jgi:hypothetical protein
MSYRLLLYMICQTLSRSHPSLNSIQAIPVETRHGASSDVLLCLSIVTATAYSTKAAMRDAQVIGKTRHGVSLLRWFAVILSASEESPDVL